MLGYDKVDSVDEPAGQLSVWLIVLVHHEKVIPREDVDFDAADGGHEPGSLKAGNSGFWGQIRKRDVKSNNSNVIIGVAKEHKLKFLDVLQVFALKEINTRSKRGNTDWLEPLPSLHQLIVQKIELENLNRVVCMHKYGEGLQSLCILIDESGIHELDVGVLRVFVGLDRLIGLWHWDIRTKVLVSISKELKISPLHQASTDVLSKVDGEPLPFVDHKEIRLFDHARVRRDATG